MNEKDSVKCSKCIHSKKIDDNTYECNAEKYDIENLTCFVPREDKAS